MEEGEGGEEREPMAHNIKGKKWLSAQNHMNNPATQNQLSHDHSSCSR